MQFCTQKFRTPAGIAHRHVRLSSAWECLSASSVLTTERVLASPTETTLTSMIIWPARCDCTPFTAEVYCMYFNPLYNKSAITKVFEEHIHCDLCAYIHTVLMSVNLHCGQANKSDLRYRSTYSISATNITFTLVVDVSLLFSCLQSAVLLNMLQFACSHFHIRVMCCSQLASDLDIQHTGSSLPFHHFEFLFHS